MEFFKRKPRYSESPEKAAKKEAIDTSVQYAQELGADLVADLRRIRENRLLRRVLKEEGNGGV